MSADQDKPPPWSRDLLWSKEEARLRRRRSLAAVIFVIATGIALGAANQGCYELLLYSR